MSFCWSVACQRKRTSRSGWATLSVSFQPCLKAPISWWQYLFSITCKLFSIWANQSGQLKVTGPVALYWGGDLSWRRTHSSWHLLDFRLDIFELDFPCPPLQPSLGTWEAQVFSSPPMKVGHQGGRRQVGIHSQAAGLPRPGLVQAEATSPLSYLAVFTYTQTHPFMSQHQYQRKRQSVS